jgi:protein N-terminal methyltransferase
MWRSQLDPAYIEANSNGNGAAASEANPETADHLPTAGNKQTWYKGSVDYWNKQPATVDGVLGGYESIHEVESDTSMAMINNFKNLMPGMNLALDCGAGIGRITKKVLKPLFATVDLVEPSSV